MEELNRIILVHYHEIGLKGHNRANFEKRLQKNLRSLLHDRAIYSITRISGCVLIELEVGTNWKDAKSCAEFVAKVPGVARVVCGLSCKRSMEDICEASKICLHEAEPFTTFKVKARRAHTDFEVDSMTMNREVGSVLDEAFPDAKVKMKSPDVVVGIEVIQNHAYVYAYEIKGIGGLPVGVSGKVCCLLSSGIDSPVATWRMAKRGAVCIGVHFSGRPQTSDTSEYLVDDIGHILEKTGCISKIYTVPLGDYQYEISLNAPPSLRVILYRRLMFKTAEQIAIKEGAGALVTGESLGQVASQTLENIRCTDDAVIMPIFRPLIGTDKQEIIYEASKLGTFEISTQDAPDCCTLFMPRSPETHAKLEKVLEAESAFPIDKWISELVESADIRTYYQK